MKRITALLLAAIMLCSTFAGCSSGGGGQDNGKNNNSGAAAGTGDNAGAGDTDLSDLEPVEILLAHGDSDGKTQSIYTEKFIELVEERSGGKITFQYSSNGEMGTQAELVEAQNNGVIDMSLTAVSMLQTYVPEVEVFFMPFLIANWDQANAVLQGEGGQWLTEKIEGATNIIPLNYIPTAFMSFLGNKEINSLEDAKGLLTRCPEADSYINMMTTLGLSPTVISFNEMYNAMATHMVDMAYSAVDTFYTNGYYQVGQYVWNTRDLIAFSSITVNSDFWASLPEAYRTIITDVIAEITPEACQAAEENEAVYIDGLKEEGVTFCEVDSYIDEIHALFEPTYQATIERLGGDTQDIYDMIVAAA